MRLGSPGQNALEGFWVGPETRTKEQLGKELRRAHFQRWGPGGGQKSGCFPGPVKALSSQPWSPDPDFPLI